MPKVYYGIIEYETSNVNLKLLYLLKIVVIVVKSSRIAHEGALLLGAADGELLTLR